MGGRCSEAAARKGRCVSGQLRSVLLLWAAVLLVVAWSGQAEGWVDPDVSRNFTQIIEAKGYPCETHHVVTQDGYILTIFRIPHGKNDYSGTRPPVLLQHGLLDSSFTWIVNEPIESLSYILADAGFDVWMSNNRGNLYSLAHVTLNPSQEEFWEFSWDEMARYDLPANVQFVLNATGYSTLGYVGHSQGTLQMFAALSNEPSLVGYFNTFVGLGPVATVGHITNELLLLLAKFDVDRLFQLLGLKQFLPSEEWLNRLFPYVCREDAGLCDSIIEYICGPHRGAFNNTRMQVVAAHEPGGTSVQNVAHFAQCIRSGLFQAYDWGEEGNLQHYNSTAPPLYDISQFPIDQLPTSLYYGTLDELADPTDVAWLLGHLSSPPRFVTELNDYAHLDYVWDILAYQEFYPQVVQLLLNGTTPAASAER